MNYKDQTKNSKDKIVRSIIDSFNNYFDLDNLSKDQTIDMSKHSNRILYVFYSGYVSHNDQEILRSILNYFNELSGVLRKHTMRPIAHNEFLMEMEQKYCIKVIIFNDIKKMFDAIVEGKTYRVIDNKIRISILFISDKDENIKELS